MKDKSLRSKILEVTESIIPPMIPRTSDQDITAFYELRNRITEKFDKRFDELWMQLEHYYGKYMPKVMPEKYDRETHKRVLSAVIKTDVKHILYGMIYEMAKLDLDKTELENNLYFDARTGFFELDPKEDVIDIIINSLFFPIFILLDLSEGKTEDLNQRITQLINRHGTYPKELFIEAYRIQEENKGKRPKITDEDAIVIANNNIKSFENVDLIDNNGQKTSMLLSITKSYSNYHKPLLKKGKGQY